LNKRSKWQSYSVVLFPIKHNVYVNTMHIITGDGTSVHTFYNILPRQICIIWVVSKGI